MSAVAIFSGPASAGSRSALVFVSVQVVPSCRVETTNTGEALDLKMRCTSTARPSVGLRSGSQVLAPVGSVTLPQSQIATTENGKTLSIEF